MQTLSYNLVDGKRGQVSEWLAKAKPVILKSFDAHFRLVAIDPFAEGDKRMAQTLMNLLLLEADTRQLQSGRKIERLTLTSLNTRSMRNDLKPFLTLRCERLDAILAGILKRFKRGIAGTL